MTMTMTSRVSATMTEPPRVRSPRHRVLDLAVVTTSALVLGASFLLVADVDARRGGALAPAPSLPATGGVAVSVGARATGLVPAPTELRRPADSKPRKVVVVRRSRAS